MARRARSSTLETRTARLKRPVQRKPYPGPSLGRGMKLLYRRNKTNGAWILKCADGHGAYWTKAFAEADDFDESNGNTVLTFFQAQDAAKALARGGDGTDATAPVTLDAALLAYKADLLARGAEPFNAEWPRVHLTAALLSKPVALLTSKELKAWRDSLLDKIEPATINRVGTCVRAACELAAQHDPRITNHAAWRVGLGALPGAQRARNTVLPDATVHALVAAAYAHDAALGLFVDALATTGARPVQVSRLSVEDLHDHPSKPKLMMPKAAKGGGRNRSQKKLERYSLPITVALSKKLKAAARGQPGNEPLLLQADGSPWGEDPSKAYWLDVREVVASIGEDPATVTLYALRHSSIVRMLLRNLPIRLIAALHNTSVQQIERNYSAHITEHDNTDDLSRLGLLAEPASVTDKVAKLKLVR